MRSGGTRGWYAGGDNPLGCVALLPGSRKELAPLPQQLWTAQDLSAFLGVPVATLYQWRYLSTGPRAYRVGRHLRYDPADVRQWLSEQAA